MPGGCILHALGANLRIVRKRQYDRANNELVEFSLCINMVRKHSGQVRLILVLARDMYTTEEKKIIKTIILSMCLAASSLSLNARAQDTLTRDALAQNDRQYTDGPVTEVNYIQVEYGHFPEYIDWLNSTWKPTMEAMKKAGLIIDYKVFQANPKSPDQPNIFLYISLLKTWRLMVLTSR